MAGKSAGTGAVIGGVLGSVFGPGGALVGASIGGAIGGKKDAEKAGREQTAAFNAQAAAVSAPSEMPDTSTAPVAGSGTSATADTGGNNQAASAALQKAQLNAERMRMQASGSRSTVLSGKMGG